ncbi:DNA-binding domain superfamily [Sesbania bispinosa]|nr:DNA-binding domain superfamily [Sesbania bispinosa]
MAYLGLSVQIWPRWSELEGMNHFGCIAHRLALTMVSLRRRRLLGLCSGNSSFVTPLPLYCENLTGYENSSQHDKPKSEQSVLSDIASVLDSNTVVKDESRSSNASGSSLSKEHPSEQSIEPPIKRRKRHSRKTKDNQEPCLMRGVYYKNMKWQAAIKVDKKQIHLGTVASQAEAAHLYDRAAFMCGREPNFQLPEEEKQELRKLKWEEFLSVTRQAITSKKHKRKHSPEPPLHRGDCASKQGVSDFSVSGDAEQETAFSRNI